MANVVVDIHEKGGLWPSKIMLRDWTEGYWIDDTVGPIFTGAPGAAVSATLGDRLTDDEIDAIDDDEVVEIVDEIDLDREV